MPSNQQGEAMSGLVLKNVGKTYYGNTVLRGVDLEVRPGELVALLGENGAGKSTLSSIIAGVIPPDTGAVMTWQGEPYAPRSPADALHAGIGLIHQEMRLLPELSIAENVFVGHWLMKGGRIDMATMVERAQRQLERLGLDVPATRKVGTLRVAAQQQVEIAKALTLDARLLILDEPTAALGDEETDRLFEQVHRLKAEGMSFIYVSHRLAEIARVADRIVVLRDGAQVAQHDTAQVPTTQLVREMVGRSVDRLFPDIAEPVTGEAALEVEGLTAPDGSFRDISFAVRPGEVFGFAGIVGAGRTELMRAIAGIDPIASGRVSMQGKTLTLNSPMDAIRAQLVLVPDDRKALGVVLPHSIADNCAYNNFDQVAPNGWISPARAAEFAAGLIRRLGVKGTPAQAAGSLSGGNQQKVVIAKWVARDPRVIILDEPTRGIDVGARAAIYEVIAELARKGMAVIVVSSDLDEVLGLSHRVMVMARGETRGVLTRAEASGPRVMELAVS
ncbi:sugar ABC transporter ATP-binding protein [Variovorax sp. J22G21]|uniref:sugar ABC transporter ATP-binding protein n=2 Tax=Variovorax fucosicus TaxID=3053517 RepID=UPI00257711A8|nr:sugar ABC transporter ATP-binding protein [Variovorax sp. J22G21]MDM0063023.1 sugar ABC transporter ATP-binding protein [Variovorax sp. J22G21]